MRAIRFAPALISILLLSGCSPPPAVHSGATRGDVELHLGPPVDSAMHDDGTRTDVYEYEIDNELGGRTVMDVSTIGIWEITYDAEDTVVDVKTSKSATGL